MLLACAISEQPRKCWPASRSLKPELRSAFAQGYGGRSSLRSSLRFKRRLERVKGIEPSCAAWEAAVLPLNYTRGGIFDFRLPMIIGSPNHFKIYSFWGCRFAILSTPCARSGQALQATKNIAKWTAL